MWLRQEERRLARLRLANNARIAELRRRVMASIRKELEVERPQVRVWWVEWDDVYRSGGGPCGCSVWRA